MQRAAMRMVVAIMLASVILAGPLMADRLVFTNGDTLSGELVAITDGMVTFVSPLVGEVSVPVGHLAGVEMDEPAPLLLDAAAAPVEARLRITDAGQQIQTAEETRRVELADIAALGAELVQQALTPPEAAEAALEIDEKAFVWTGSIEAGLSGRSGNTSDRTFVTNFGIRGENPDWRLSAYAGARYAEKKDAAGEWNRTDNEIRGGGRAERLFGPHWSAFGAIDLERDEFEQIDLRSIFTGGMSYAWVDTERWFYQNSAGLGYQYEKYDNGDTESTCIATLESHLIFRLNRRVEFTQDTFWRPELGNYRDYRLTAETAAVVYLNEDRSLFLRGGLRHKYDSRPAAGAERLDTFYFTNVGYSF